MLVVSESCITLANMGNHQELERETRRGSARRRGGRAPPEALAWNDAAWEVPWHNMVGEVSFGGYASGHGVLYACD